MTILPKKKHQESRKNEQDQDENRNRRHNRTSQRNRNHPNTLDDLGSGNDPGSSPLASSVPYDDFDDLSRLENSDEGSSRLPQKRSRHRPTNNFYLSPSSTPAPSGLNVVKSRSTSREGSRSPAACGGSAEDDDEEEEDGYNSSDEHGERLDETTKGATLEVLNEDRKSRSSWSNNNIALSKIVLNKLSYEVLDHLRNKMVSKDADIKIQREEDFERELREKKGFIIKQMATDGACMFRAVADHVYGDQEMHSVVRRHCMDYMVKNRDFFSQYITEDFSSYIRRKRNEHAHGNHIEMQALSEMYNRPIEVYQYSYEPINTFHSRTHGSDDNAPIRLSYHGNVHYNSVIDPYNPTVGVGLGLAGYKPGHDNKELLRKTINESEATLLEQEMLEDKIKATDWEATDDQLAEVAARESYMQWLKDSQKQKSCGASSSSSSSTTQSQKDYEKHSKKSPPREQPRRSPRNDLAQRESPSRETSNLSSRRSPRNENSLRESPAYEKTRKSPKTEDRLSRKSPPRDANSSDKISGPVNKQSRGNSPVNKQSDVDEETPCSSSQGACASSADWTYSLGYAEEWDNDPVLAAVLAQSQQEYLNSISNKNKNNKEGGGGTS